MGVEKRPYKRPRLVRAGSFEELTRGPTVIYSPYVIFGIDGRAAGMHATS